MEPPPRIRPFPPGRPPNVFAGSRLDRAAQLRRDPEWLAARLADPESLLLPFWRGRHLVLRQEVEVRAVRLRVGEAAALVGEAATTVLLGLEEGLACFGLDVSSWDEAEAAVRLGATAEPVELAELRSVGALLPEGDAALLAHVRGLLHWHSRHGHCGVCGAPTESRDGGAVRRCTGCGADHFPRTDPAVIMLVTDGDRCLLGRQAAWPEGVYSTLAGFLEPGESLEEAVAREVREEAGIEVADMVYHSSQPWPFPSSVMLGFTARAVTTELLLDPAELDDARWFERAELADPATRPIRFPSPTSIARRLIEDWLAE